MPSNTSQLLTKAEPGLDLLLITLPNNIDKVMGIGQRFVSPMEPYGLLCIAATVREAGFRVGIMDAFAMNYGFQEIFDEIKRLKPKVVGFPVFTVQATLFNRLAGEIRNIFPELKIIAGNIHAGIYYDYILKNHFCDIVIHDEAEYITVEVMRALENGDDLKNVKGISYLENKQVIKNDPADIITDLDRLPTPAWDLIHMNLYHMMFYYDSMGGQAKFFAQIYTTRGCPYRCKFCAVHHNRQVRYLSVPKVLDQMEILYKQYGKRYLCINDSLFMITKERIEEICHGIIDRGLKISWHCEGRVNFACQNLETLKLMKKAGCVQISYGVESGNQEVLNICNKNLSLDQVRRAVINTKEAGIEIGGLFILGLPGDTVETCEQTIDFACELDLDIAQFAIFVPFPGSPFYDEFVAAGRIDPLAWDQYAQYLSLSDDNNTPVYIPDGMTSQNLMDLQRLSFRRFFLRPKIIWKFIKKIRIYNILDYVFAGWAMVVRR